MIDMVSVVNADLMRAEDGSDEDLPACGPAHEPRNPGDAQRRSSREHAPPVSL